MKEKELPAGAHNNWFERLPKDDQEALQELRIAQFPELKKGAEIFYQIPSTNKMILFKGDKQEARPVNAWANAQSLIAEAQIDDLRHGISYQYEIDQKPILLPPNEWQQISSLTLNELVVDNGALTILRKPMQATDDQPQDHLMTPEETTVFIKAIPSVGLNHS